MGNSPVRVLLIEDDEDDYILVRKLLSQITAVTYDLQWAPTYEAAVEAMDRGHHDVYLLDYRLGERTGLEFLHTLNGKGSAVPVIFLTGHADYGLDVDAIRAGASDYLVKGQIHADLLERSIRYAIERKRLEEQLRQAQKMEAIGTLAGGIAHDFNNMLAAIIGNAEMAMDDLPKEMTARHNLDQIFKAGMRARDLVRQILTFSRKTEQEHKPLPLTPIVNETFRLLRSSLPTIIEMRLNIETSSDVALVDPVQIQQILMNLCTNAGDAMRHAGGHLEVSLTDTVFRTGDPLPEAGMQPGTYVTLTVRDTGPGIHEDIKSRIFEPFFTTKERGQGTGMGLAVVYGIVQSHQGAITVLSQPGQGATFTVYLPHYTSGEKATDEPTSRAAPKGKERILFVDDEELLVELAEGMLERLGYNVVCTTDSMSALQTFAKDPGAFDLVITDHTMPQMTGATLAQKLKEIRPDIPIILCTGYSETISREKAESMGIDGFVIKPLSRNELAETVRRVLDMKAQA